MALRLFSLGDPVGLPASEWHRWLPFGLAMMRRAHQGHFARGTMALPALLAEAMPAWRRLDTSLPESPIPPDAGHYVAWESKATARKGPRAWGNAPTGTATFRRAEAADIELLRQIVPKAQIRDAIRFARTAT